jgi:hypothetical protein
VIGVTYSLAESGRTAEITVTLPVGQYRATRKMKADGKLNEATFARPVFRRSD